MIDPVSFRAAFSPAMRLWWRLSRSMTLGVRVIAEDEKGRIALIKHSYAHGWHFPGGGVERGETAEEAARREAAEEAGVMAESLALFGVYSNHAKFKNDHVFVFQAPEWRPTETDSAGEIIALDWFHPDALPDDAVGAVRRRIKEAYFGAPQSKHW